MLSHSGKQLINLYQLLIVQELFFCINLWSSLDWAFQIFQRPFCIHHFMMTFFPLAFLYSDYSLNLFELYKAFFLFKFCPFFLWFFNFVLFKFLSCISSRCSVIFFFLLLLLLLIQFDDQVCSVRVTLLMLPKPKTVNKWYWKDKKEMRKMKINLVEINLDCELTVKEVLMCSSICSIETTR